MRSTPKKGFKKARKDKVKVLLGKKVTISNRFFFVHLAPNRHIGIKTISCHEDQGG